MAALQSYLVFALMVLTQSVYGTPIKKKENILIRWNGTDFGVDKKIKPVTSDSCKSYNVCDQVDNYPTDLANWILKELKRKNIIKYTLEKEYDQVFDSSHTMCNSTIKTYYPKAAYSTEMESWQFILNLDNVHFQGFYVKICNGQSQCNNVKTTKRTSCEQSYAEKKMLYMDLQKEVLTPGSFLVPLCCSCKFYPIDY